MDKNFDAYSRIFLGICLLLGAGILLLKPIPNRFIFEKVTERDFTTSKSEGTETTYTIKDTATGKIYNYSRTLGMLENLPFRVNKVTAINPLLGSVKEKELPLDKVSKIAFSERLKEIKDEKQ